MINVLNIALSGLNAAGQKIAATASNIANVTTAGSLDNPDDAPYSALTTQQTTQSINGEGAGVSSRVIPANKPFVPAYSPDSPFANEDGLIGVPNVDLAEEAINLQVAEITFKANASVIRSVEETSDELFRIFDEEV